MNINEKKKGEIPNIDLETVEGEIMRLESQLKNRDNILVFNKFNKIGITNV
jgi:GTPase involved in cell partitioning and DNA repair